MATLDTITSILDVLVPIIQNEVNLHLNSKSEAEALVFKLEDIKLLLDDAERKQLSDRSINRWLGELQDIAYDVEDALDVWEAKNRELQQELDRKAAEEEDQKKQINLLEKICLPLGSLCSCFNEVVERRTIALEIKGLNERIDKIYKEGLEKQLQRKQLFDGASKRVSSINYESEGSSNSRTITTSGYIKSQVKGRENDKEKLRKMLLVSDVATGAGMHDINLDVEVIGIAGQGGLGKTTLAKLIYDDREVIKEFPIRIWVCVSDPFKVLEIAKNILEQLEGRSPSVSSPEALMQRVKNLLRDKKFLLVLDDVWTEKSDEWEQLKAYLCDDGGKGSKILVTTRKVNTADAVGAFKRYRLQKMEDEECWSIIRQTALPEMSEGDCDTRLEEIGRKIAEKCDGLPLAAKMLGGVLKNKERNVREWKEVFENEIWKLEDVEENLFRHFFLSYDELKPAMKRCFSYCAVFPKDYKIYTEDLVRIWMAQGFLSSSSSAGEDDRIEEKGYGYFKDLAQRSFFQDLEKDDDGYVYSCKMHDIVHDFAQYLSGNDQFARHFYWEQFKEEEHEISDPFSAERLRSLFCCDGLPTNVRLGELTRARVLRLEDCNQSAEDLKEIGDLIHLRYLDLSWSDSLTELPEAICNLYNLQTLVFNSCNRLSRFPPGICNLRNLRFLIDNSESPIEFPSGIASLTNLQHLPLFYVKEGFNDLRYLKNLNRLIGSLSIKLIGSMSDAEAANEAALRRKTSIVDLSLEYDEEVSLQVLDALQPHPHLESLYIKSRGLIRLPSWITVLENLKKLTIALMEPHTAPVDSSSFPYPLWKLPSLEHLRFWYDYCVGRCMGNGFYGLVHNAVNSITAAAAADDQLSDHQEKSLVAFPALKTLDFRSDYRWTDWKEMTEEEAAAIRNNNIVIMPRLTKIRIHWCKGLKTLPHGALQQLPSLHTLHIVYCPKLEENYGAASTTSILHSYIPNVIFQE